MNVSCFAPRTSDLEFYFELRNRPEILALPGRQPRLRSDVERQLRGWIDRWQQDGFGTWTVFDRETDEQEENVR